MHFFAPFSAPSSISCIGSDNLEKLFIYYNIFKFLSFKKNYVFKHADQHTQTDTPVSTLQLCFLQNATIRIYIKFN